MSALDKSWGLTTADDDLHPRNDDPWWTETVWFAWMVPERNLCGYYYLMMRPNKDIQAGGVLVYDETAELPWELPVFDYNWHHQLPPGVDLRNATFNNGMTLRCLEPTRSFHLGYEGRDLRLDLQADAVSKPLVTASHPPFNKGHIDQICRVTGEMVMHGETIEVDCYAMRDRSWGPRQDGRQPQVGYSYATYDADNSYLAVTVAKDGVYNTTTGFLIRDGHFSRMVGGHREVHRDENGSPVGFTLEASDEEGRTVQATGRMVSRQVFTPYPSMFAWNCLVEWTDSDGNKAWGEDQDCWHPRKWRQFRAEQRASRNAAGKVAR